MKRFLLLALMVMISSANAAGQYDFKGPSPWPEIRKQRIAQLLPQAMQAANIDAWIVICRENDNDPLADHVGGENAGGEASLLFYISDKGLQSVAFSPESESTALSEAGIHDKVIAVKKGESSMKQAAAFIKQQQFQRIAVNNSDKNAQADGLSFSQRMRLQQALGQSLSDKLVSSEELVYEWLSIKLPAEIDIMTAAAELTAQWQLEAYQQVIPGKTTDAEVAALLKQKMQQHGVSDGWAPDQNPNVNSGVDRGHSHATDKVIMPGDVIQTDFGIRVYDRWVTDIQRFAYVLRADETAPPADIASYWQHAKAGGYQAFKTMKPGVKGVEVDAAQKDLMVLAKSLPVIWSTGHPVGYVAHDTGPNLGGSHSPSSRPAAQKKLKQGMVFAFDGFHSWHLEDGGVKTISVEEMVEITEDGARYLIPRQQDLVLIKSK
ncbi:M24 family metallopeptidase [Thalassotalea sp. HSM 43]|uniref:M24 family metallopeptidase n=1 Tax=Thalassotalea sp. HSM 43 TaxID=2552945 RepID=UPI00107FE838|nr:M24 family metallopeptidase [Thalassotalea sp. HSM 43]QBY04340.1 M24 family metallopeptidase [Thalassotalea sp. HSM 43]